MAAEDERVEPQYRPEVMKATKRERSLGGTHTAVIWCIVGSEIPSATPIRIRHAISTGRPAAAAGGVRIVHSDQKNTPRPRTGLPP